MTANYVNKNLKNQKHKEKYLKLLEEKSQTKLAMYKKPGIRMASDQKKKINANLELYTQVIY